MLLYEQLRRRGEQEQISFSSVKWIQQSYYKARFVNS